MKSQKMWILTVSLWGKVFLIFMLSMWSVGCVDDDSSQPTIPGTPTPGQPSPTTWRTMLFSGYVWRVKTSDIPIGPGPNYFSDSTENVWVDESGQLHLRITQREGKWYCPEVVSQDSFGYGTYRFSLTGNIDQVNEHVVLGLFTWDDDPSYAHREIDIELAQWGDVANQNAQFVVQPYTTSGNMYRFGIHLDDRDSVYSFEWTTESILFQAMYDDNSSVPDSNAIIDSWRYTGQDVSPPGHENARMNLWLFRSISPSDGQEVEVIIKAFEYIPFVE